MKLLTSLRNAQAEFVRKASAIQEVAAGEERAMTDAERAELQGYLDEAKATKAKIDRVEGDRDLLDQVRSMIPSPGQSDATEADHSRQFAPRQMTHGEAFTESANYQAITQNRGAQFSTGAVELQAIITTGGASAGALVEPDRQGLLRILSAPLYVADLLGAATTNSNSIVVPTESVITNAAAAVLETGTKPLSTITYSSITEPVKKLAHIIKLSDESVSDIPYLRSMVDGRGRLMLEQVEEAQLLSGDGIGPNLLGILNRAGMTAAQARGADTNFDAIHKEITKIALASFLYPDGIVVNPTNWETMALAKDTTGRYIGTGPFDSSQVKRLWGLPVVATTGITAGTALIGAFKVGAAVVRRTGMTVEMTNSNEDDFRKNLIALRFEKRLALAFFRPSSFGTATGLN